MLTNHAPLGIILLLSCGGSTSSTEFDASTGERTDADLLAPDAAPDAMTSPHSYACTQVAEAPGDGIFSLRAFEGRLFAGMFGYGQGGSSMLWQYPNWQRTMPGILGVGESICAMSEPGSLAEKASFTALTSNPVRSFRKLVPNKLASVFNAPCFAERGCFAPSVLFAGVSHQLPRNLVLNTPNS